MRNLQAETLRSSKKIIGKKALIGVILAGLLVGCGDVEMESDYPDTYEGATKETGSLFDNFTFGLGKQQEAEPEEQAEANNKAPAVVRGLAVNPFLWRAALETISFMPLASTDPVGGVITTDWYNSPSSPGERVKINIVILCRELRGDAISVSLFREKQINGRWSSVAGSTLASRQLENIVLTKARDFKVASAKTEN